ncbi:hypothetical protein WN55_01254 [Dufourea novaeangliae]|uniref:Uncharacterized protein n=1 Tax=Dufourea novaeangliae TaxID=178035 RepID=A0A154NWM1_DUFNO|nr:hypothetical protein WN55_01254 [Dufourea novaeangliae]
MYDDDGTTADQKIEDDRSVIETEGIGGDQIIATSGGIGVGVGIGIGGPGAAAGGGTGLASYWQHATTASYWPSLLDCWPMPPIASGSQTLSLPRDEN